jgi:uncharacterized protein (UPF0276 family)
VIQVGLTLQPDEEFLDLVAPLLPSVDYFEVAPETTWWEAPTDPDALPGNTISPLVPNGFHRRFAALGQRLGKGFVGHGVGLSLGTTSRADAPRRRRWLARLRADQAVFGFRWYTDHLGASSLAGQAVALPLPLPYSAYAAAVIGQKLRALQAIIPDVGVENTAQYFVFGDPLAEPAFLSRVLRGAGTHLLLDLHNLYTMAENLGFDAAEYLARLDHHRVLARVIEIHVSGGSYSDGSWLPSQRSLRLNSHDAAVPEPVWQLLSSVLPRCPHLRGVTLERMEGTLSVAELPLLATELARIRQALAKL